MCKDCDEQCTCFTGIPPCNYCIEHGECVRCGEMTCETVLDLLDGDKVPMCIDCQQEE